MDGIKPIGRSRGRVFDRTSVAGDQNQRVHQVVGQNAGDLSPAVPRSSSECGLETCVDKLSIQEGPSNLPGKHAGREPFSLAVITTRPQGMVSKQGTSGIHIKVQANYFKLCSVTDWSLYQYHVHFSPEEDRTSIRKAIMKEHRSAIGGFLFDGMILYTSCRLAQNPLILQSKREGDNATIKISITFSQQLIYGEHDYMQFFNILMRKCLGSLNLHLVGRNFFDPYAKVQMPDQKMELWPGYVTSIRQHDTDILMCTEITHKVMRQDTVLHLLVEVQQESNKNGSNDWQDTFRRIVLGLVVLTDYNNRTYRIDDVDFQVSPSTSFKLRNDRFLTYAEYYADRYNIHIRHLYQPLLVTKSKSRELKSGLSETVYLIPELCRMTGLSDAMRGDFQLMTALAEHTRMGPKLRVQKLLAFSERLKKEPSVVEDLNMWNMTVANQLVSFDARVLPQEMIKQGNGNQVRTYPAGANTDWTGRLRASPMLSMADVCIWVVMVPNFIYKNAAEFIQLVMQAAKNMQMYMEKPQVISMPDDRQSTYVNHLSQLLSSQNPQLVVCIVSNNRADRYSAIKKICCVDRAVASQVITNRCLTNRNAQSIAIKVAVQINCKLGGAPWSVDVPMKGTMIVGFDVTADTFNKQVTFGALVATLDNNLSQYYATVACNHNAQEISNDVSINLLKALHKYRIKNNGCLPSRIVLYRDGVGDGQIPFVQQHEVAVLKERLSEVYGESKYQLAVIVVSKRINTRFFTDTLTNPPPGTVVDSCVTLPERFDFFIVSQNVRQGTVSPTSYNVIWDNTGLGPDKLQRLTYKLTHLYYNWSGTVRVPAPVQYAHKLAMLTAQSLHKPPHTGLENVLFFL